MSLITWEPSGPYVLLGKAGGVTLFKLLPLSRPLQLISDWELSSYLPGLDSQQWRAGSADTDGLKNEAETQLAQWLGRVQAEPEREPKAAVTSDTKPSQQVLDAHIGLAVDAAINRFAEQIARSYVELTGDADGKSPVWTYFRQQAFMRLQARAGGET